MFDLLGEAAALGAAVCWTSTSLVFTGVSRVIGATSLNRGRVLYGVVFLSLLHLAVAGSPFPTDATAEQWEWFAVSSVLGLIVSDTLSYKAYGMIGPRLTTLFKSCAPVISAVLALAFLGESNGWTSWIGILAGTAGVLLVSVSRTSRAGQGATGSPRRYLGGIACGLGSALGQAGHLVAIKYAMHAEYPALSATLIRTFIAFVLLWGASALTGSLAASFCDQLKPGVRGNVLLGSLVGPCLGIFLSVYAVKHVQVGVASTLMALPPVLLVGLEISRGRPLGSATIGGTLLSFAGTALLLSRA